MGISFGPRAWAVALVVVMMGPSILWAAGGDANVEKSPAGVGDDPTAGEPVVFVERLVCRRERTIGSNLPQRVCRTETEMVRDREAAQELLRRQESHPRDAPRQR